MKTLTKETCLSLHGYEELHYTGNRACTCNVGPKGGITLSITRCRQSGKVQVWKTRPANFRMPVKHGLYESSVVTERNCADFHLADDCPALQQAGQTRT